MDVVPRIYSVLPEIIDNSPTFHYSLPHYGNDDFNNIGLNFVADSGLINDDKATGEPFFDETGQVSQPVKDILNFLTQLNQSKAVTNSAVAALADTGIITEWSLKIKDGDQEKPVTGLYRIDEAKLNSLDDDQFIKLRKTGALPIAYAQLLSMDNIQVFEKLAKVQKQATAKTPDVSSFLSDDDVISFQ